MTSNNDNKRLSVKQDRTLIRTRWHSKRFVVAHVTAPEAVHRHRATRRSTWPSSSTAPDPWPTAAIELAMKAVEEGIARLKSSDRFSVVVYDDRIDSLVTGAFATAEAKRDAIERLRSVDARGMTDLSGGWLRGCEHVASELLELGVNRCLLLTDGLANHGITTLEELEHHAARAAQAGRLDLHLRRRRQLQRGAAAGHGPGGRWPVLRHRERRADPRPHRERGR